MSGIGPKELDIRRSAFAQGGILFDANSLPQAVPAMLEPDHWPGAVPLDGRGGRGVPWLVRGDFGEAVLRHYRRGGLVGRVISDHYLYSGQARVRSLREFELLAQLWRKGLPVPRPLLAGWQRSGLHYRADLMTLRVPHARTMAESLAAGVPSPWAEIGRTIARFHQAGVFHADLNAHNVMIDADDKVWLIDFDRGRLRVPSQDWQRANLRRLRRSLDKLGGVAAGDWQALEAAYLESIAGHVRKQSA